MRFEYPEYGTPDEPAQLVREVDGSNYYAYESAEDGTLVLWSTDKDFLECLADFYTIFGSEQSDAEPSLMGFADDGHVKIFDGTTQEVLTASLNAVDDLRFVRLTFGGASFVWKAPFQRFHDREDIMSEVSVQAASLDIEKARKFARLTGDATFFVMAGCIVRMWQDGTFQQRHF